MGQSIFRKKSLDKINSPESLNDYIRVTNPGVWLVLIAVISLLIGACTWSYFGHIDSTVDAYASVSGGKAVCLVSREDISSVEKGMKINIDGAEGSVTGIGSYVGEKDCYEVFADVNKEDGSYDAEIVIRSVKPASFVFN